MDFLKDPPILFFLLGLASVALNTGLRVPALLSKFFALYLLMAIGFKGGLSLGKSGLSEDFLIALAGGVVLSVLTPAMVFFALRRRMAGSNAAALAATYGSVSAVTFVAATSWLENRGFEFAGFMVAVLAIMEAPAIIVGLLLAFKDKGSRKIGMGKLLHEALLNGSVFLLLGSVVVGLISGPFGKESVGPFILDLFKGFLGFFLLDLGIRAGMTLKRAALPLWLIPVGLIVPMIGALLALGWGMAFGLPVTETFLLMTLGAGASYIAVPAALKDALPEADPGVYLTLALGVTFPFNLLVGLPLYWWLVKSVLV